MGQGGVSTQTGSPAILSLAAGPAEDLDPWALWGAASDGGTPAYGSAGSALPQDLRRRRRPRGILCPPRTLRARRTGLFT